MQTYGWGAGILNSEELTDVSTLYVGTEGQSKRMEALKISCRLPEGVTLKYRAHVQTYGWLDWVDVGDSTKYAGTEGQSKRMEGVQISVSGLEDYGYRLLYRAHVQTYGWLDWVDAENPNAYAGTDHESKRMEALEIAIIPRTDLNYVNDGNGQHRIEYKGKLIGMEDCSYGDWTASSSITKLSQECTLCEHTGPETKTLAALFEEATENGDGVVTLDTLTVDKAFTVPEENTLVVNELKLTGSKNIKNEGTIIARKISNSGTEKIVNSGDSASVTVKGKYVTGEKAVLANAMKVNGVTNIEVEEGSVTQKVTAKVDINKGRKLTVDLNGTKVDGKSIENGYIIDNKGDLTINDGIFIANTTNGKGIQSTGSLEVNGGSVTASDYAFRLGDEETNNKNMVVSLNDVTIKTVGTVEDGAGIVLRGNNGTVNLNNVDITSNGFSICSYGRDKVSSFNVVGGTLTSKKSVAVYLPASGDSTFTNVEITGAEGIEALAGSVTLNGCTVTANGVAGGDTLTLGQSTAGGHAILLRVDKDYKVNTKAKTLSLTVSNSTITSKNSYAVLIKSNSATEGSDCIVKTVNTSYDLNSVVSGKLGAQHTDTSVKATVVTTGIED